MPRFDSPSAAPTSLCGGVRFREQLRNHAWLCRCKTATTRPSLTMRQRLYRNMIFCMGRQLGTFIEGLRSHLGAFALHCGGDTHAYFFFSHVRTALERQHRRRLPPQLHRAFCKKFLGLMSAVRMRLCPREYSQVLRPNVPQRVGREHAACSTRQNPVWVAIKHLQRAKV
jgi:hypothetical protein